MKKISLLFVSLWLVCGLQAQSLKKSDRNAILQVLSQQEGCWNKGDLECFMEGYWRSDSLMFIGSRGLTYGWQQTLDNYKKGYPDKAAMGKLTFEILHIKATGKKAALVIGKWMLTRPEKGDLAGHFSLVWKRINKEWVIVADHSS